MCIKCISAPLSCVGIETTAHFVVRGCDLRFEHDYLRSGRVPSILLCSYCVYIMGIHIHIHLSVLGGRLVVRSFHFYSTPLIFGHTSLPLASSAAKVIVWLIVGIRSDNRTATAAVCPVGAGLFSSDVMSCLIHASAVHQRGEEGCDLRVCGCGF